MTEPQNQPEFAVYVEIQDLADSMSVNAPLEQLGAAGAMEIAKVLTRFDDQIEDEWRVDLLRIAAGLLKLMLTTAK